jgi:Alpha-galactosidase
LISPQAGNDFVAWQIVAKDKSESLVTIVATDVLGNQPFFYLKLRGLQVDAKYQVDGKVYSGATLLNAGLKLKQLKGNYPSQQIYLQKI